MPYATVCTVQVWFVHIFANYELLLLIIELLNDGRGFIWSWKREKKKALTRLCFQLPTLCKFWTLRYAQLTKKQNFRQTGGYRSNEKKRTLGKLTNICLLSTMCLNLFFFTARVWLRGGVKKKWYFWVMLRKIIEQIGKWNFHQLRNGPHHPKVPLFFDAAP